MTRISANRSAHSDFACCVAALFISLAITSLSPARAQHPLFEDPIVNPVGTQAGPIFGGEDMNGDGIMDIVVLDRYGNNVKVCLGQGDGTFAQQTPAPTTGNPISLTIADFNRDGNVDVAVATHTPADKVHIFLGDGAGNLTVDFTFTAGPSLYSIAQGDFNHDDWLDIVVTNATTGASKVRFFGGDSLGTFTEWGAGYVVGDRTSTWSLLPYHWDEDDHLDVAVNLTNGKAVRILFGDGQGGFTVGPPYSPGPALYALNGIQQADLNEDGYEDIASVNNNSHGYCVFLGGPGGTFTPQTPYIIPSSSLPGYMVLGDIDQDQIFDMVVSDYGIHKVIFFKGNGDGTFTETYPRVDVPGAGFLVVADFNQDGVPDLAAGSTTADVLVYLGHAPEPEAACCFADGLCSVLTQSDCTSLAGVWQGEIGLCDPNPCPQPPGEIVGTVSVDGVPLTGATVDLYAAAEPQPLIASALTDTYGTYGFAELEPGDYGVEVVIPLGYEMAAGYTAYVEVTLPPGETVTVDFVLSAIVTVVDARSSGYWKHQYKAHESGRGQVHESLADLAFYHTEILNRFYGRSDQYAVQILGVTYSPGPAALTMDDARATLSPGKQPSMLERAYCQYLALLLNVVSGKVGQPHVATFGGSTVAQIIAYVGILLEDGDPANDELAKDLAEMVNHNELIPGDPVPESIPNIAYRRAEALPSSQLSLTLPNPAQGRATIRYYVPAGGSDVSLRIFDAQGRVLKTLVQGPQAPGMQHVNWLVDDNAGRRLANGVYFCRIQIGNRAESRRIQLLRP